MEARHGRADSPRLRFGDRVRVFADRDSLVQAQPLPQVQAMALPQLCVRGRHRQSDGP